MTGGALSQSGIFQSRPGSDQIGGVKTLAEASVDLGELRAISVGGLSQLVQVMKTHANPKLKGFRFLFARDVKALAEIMLRLIQIAA
jgi:hypothetical protein